MSDEEFAKFEVNVRVDGLLNPDGSVTVIPAMLMLPKRLGLSPPRPTPVQAPRPRPSPVQAPRPQPLPVKQPVGPPRRPGPPKVINARGLKVVPKD